MILSRSPLYEVKAVINTVLSEEIMKNTRLNSILSSSLIVCALTIVLLGSTQSASADVSKSLAKVDIPFAFQAANRTLPAGTYQIDSDSNDIILLHGPNRATVFQMMFKASRLHPADHGAVVFYHYGSKYFLHQIWTEGATNGLECTKSHAEKNALKAQNNQAATLVELAFNNAPLK